MSVVVEWKNHFGIVKEVKLFVRVMVLWFVMELRVNKFDSKTLLMVPM